MDVKILGKELALGKGAGAQRGLPWAGAGWHSGYSCVDSVLRILRQGSWKQVSGLLTAGCSRCSLPGCLGPTATDPLQPPAVTQP